MRNGWHGFIIDNSRDISLHNNVMENTAISIRGDNLTEWTSHSIDSSNTVNTKPVYYLKRPKRRDGTRWWRTGYTGSL